MQMTIKEIMQIVGQLYVENIALNAQVQSLTAQLVEFQEQIETAAKGHIPPSE